MDDDAFLSALESGRLANEAFRHADHVRATYLYLRRFGYPAGVDAIESTIRRFAAAHGVPDKFHFTLTVAWARFVAAHCAGGCARPFHAFIDQNGELLDKTLPLRYYSRERLFDPAARQAWREPDLESLPSVTPWRPIARSMGTPRTVPRTISDHAK